MGFVRSPWRIIALAAGIIALGLLMFWFVYTSEHDIGHNITYVPEYPGAQQIETQIADKIQTGNLNVYPVDTIYMTMTFSTVDPIERVFAYYKNDLARRPFEDWSISEAGIKDNTLYLDGTDRSGATYMFRVTAQQQNGLTHVKVERLWLPRID